MERRRGSGKSRLPVVLAGLLLLPFGAVSAEVLVSAAISLRDILDGVRPAFREAGDEFVLNAAGSGTLLRQILRGAPADLFLSASPVELDELERKGMLVPGTRCTLASNRIVAIFSQDGPAVDRFRDLPLLGRGKIAVGNPKTVPAGRYARDALVSLDLWNTVKDRLVYAENVRQAVEYVARGDVDAAIVYATDAKRFQDRVRLGPAAPGGSYPAVLYQGAVLKAGPEKEKAGELLKLLRSRNGRELFRRYGFQDPP